MMELTGDIPGLLRFGSIVRLADDRLFVVTDVDGEDFAITIGTRGHWEKAARLRLDLTSRTGRFHAREWLAERGHDVGNEDRAEVLAWSVLSVWRGGRPLLGVANADAFSTSWNQDRLDAGWALTNPDGSLTLPPLPGGAL